LEDSIIFFCIIKSILAPVSCSISFSYSNTVYLSTDYSRVKNKFNFRTVLSNKL